YCTGGLRSRTLSGIVFRDDTERLSAYARGQRPGGAPPPSRRAARRPRPGRRAASRPNDAALLAAARTVFDTSGVAAPAKEITDRAGVGVGTLYRHFPHRSALAKAVVESGSDDVAQCA